MGRQYIKSWASITWWPCWVPRDWKLLFLPTETWRPQTFQLEAPGTKSVVPGRYGGLLQIKMKWWFLSRGENWITQRRTSWNRVQCRQPTSLTHIWQWVRELILSRLHSWGEASALSTAISNPDPHKNDEPRLQENLLLFNGISNFIFRNLQILISGAFKSHSNTSHRKVNL